LNSKSPDSKKQEASPQEIRIALFGFLSYRPRTRFEALRKFKKLGGPESYADEALEEFEELGLIDDEKFAHDFIHVRLRSKRHGRVRISRDLRRKGISSDLVERGLAALVTEDLEVEAAKKAIPLKWIRKEKPLSREDLNKLKAASMRRGFAYSIVKKAIEEMD